VDEAWADTAAARGAMSSLLWRPCVKFLSTHYKYVKDPTSDLPRLLQRGVGSDPESVAHFRRPVSNRPVSGLAFTSTGKEEEVVEAEVEEEDLGEVEELGMPLSEEEESAQEHSEAEMEDYED